MLEETAIPFYNCYLTFCKTFLVKGFWVNVLQNAFLIQQ